MSTNTETLTPLQAELLSRADSIFDSIGKSVEKASTFASEQIPDIAMQYVAFGRASSSVFLAICFLMFIVGSWLLIRVAVMNSRKYPESWALDDRRVGAALAGAPLMIVSFIAMIISLNSFLMVWFAPKVWLINELAHLVKK